MGVLKRYSKPETGCLFERKGNFRFVKLGRIDALRSTDNLKLLRSLIESGQQMYPLIGRWFSKKVVPGLRSEERIAWLAYEGEHPIASAVLKLGKRSKFCHLRIHREFQDMDLGQMFFTQMSLEARHHAREIHFTLPESLWYEKSQFFESFGFSSPVKAYRQYRPGDIELACSAPISTVQQAVFRKLPTLTSKFSIGDYSLRSDILISIKPQYARGILAGTKVVEIRKRFSDKWVGCRAVLYASSPQKAIIGEATVRSVVVGSPMDIWNEFGQSVGCSFVEFDAYVGSSKEVNAIELDDVVPYEEPISLAQMSHLLQEELRPPQSYCDLRLDEAESPWAKAVSIASLLHGRFSPVKRISENSV